MKIALLTPFGHYNTVPRHQRHVSAMQASMREHTFVHVEVDMNVVHKARNMLVDMIPDDVDVAWWVDSDVLLPANAPLLMHYLSDKSPVVSGLYVSRNGPNLPQAYTLASNSGHAYLPIVNIPNEPTYVDAVGLGCLVMYTKVFLDLSVAWQKRLRVMNTWLKRQTSCPDLEMVSLAMGLSPYFEFLNKVGEDFYFCERLRDIGIRPLLVPEVSCTHVGYADFTRDHYEANLAQGVNYNTAVPR